MPFGDRTGPQGLGSMTGRGMGYCAGYNMPGYANPGIRRPFSYQRFGSGFGRGRGFRNWYYATGLPGWARINQGLPAWGGRGYYPSQRPPSNKKQIKILEREATNLKEELKVIEEEIRGLKKEK